MPCNGLISYNGENGEIYTENIIESKKVLKGNDVGPIFSIITLGGNINGVNETWTNVLNLNIGEFGAFFIKPTIRPKNVTSFFLQFDVYLEGQGFYQYTRNGVCAIFSNFLGRNSFYKSIGVEYDTDQLIEEKRQNINSENCVVYSMEKMTPNELSSTLVFNLFVKYSKGHEKLFRGECFLEYDSDWFGCNIVSEGVLSFTINSTFGLDYDLILEDYAKNTLRVLIEPKTKSYNELLTVSNQKESLGYFTIKVKGFSLNEPLNVDYSQPNITNTYLNNRENEIDFECMKFEISKHKCGVDIDSINDVVAAGVGDESENGIVGILTIRGEGFLDPAIDINQDGLPDEKPTCIVPGRHRVFFQKIQSPTQPGETYTGQYWIAPLEGDYLVYSDNLIKVRVPSYHGYDEDGIQIEGQYAIASSGKIRVAIDLDGNGNYFDDNCFDDKGWLNIKFSAHNNITTNGHGCPKAKKIKLPSKDLGGISFFLFPKMDPYLTEFYEGLSEWRCSTVVNFSTNNGSGADFITTTNALPHSSTSIVTISCNPVDYVRTVQIGFQQSLFEGHTNAWRKSVIMHELGHAHLLGHVLEDTKIMKTSLENGGWPILSLPEDDILGGQHISELSSSSANNGECTLSNMLLINDEDCVVNYSGSNSIKSSFSNGVLFPNPFKDEIEIKDISLKELVIYDIHGILKLKIEMRNIKKLNVEWLSKGIFIFKMTTITGKIFYQKMIKYE